MSTGHFTSPQPEVQFIAGSKNVQVMDYPIVYVDSKGFTWVAPVGTMTDGASIPQAFWSLIGNPFTDSYFPAAILHDRAYANAPGNEKDEDVADKSVLRKAADDMLQEAAIAGGTSSFKAYLLHTAVRNFGGKPWANCARVNSFIQSKASPTPTPIKLAPIGPIVPTRR